MKEIGEYLRKTREEKGISLNEVQEKTKIRLRYLEAIEEGNLDVIPGEVYCRGFIVNYANAIGIDGNHLLEEYAATKKEEEKQLQLEADSANSKKESKGKIAKEIKLSKEKKKTASSNNASSKVTSKFNLVLILCLIIPLIAGILLINRIPGLSFFQKNMTETNEPKVNEPEVQPTLNEAPMTQKDEDVQTSQIFPAPVTVYAEFSERVWVQVEADGETLFLKDGITFDSSSPKQVWTAQKELTIRLGNPRGIHLSLNGKDLGLIGERGIPKTIKITADGLVAP